MPGHPYRHPKSHLVDNQPTRHYYFKMKRALLARSVLMSAVLVLIACGGSPAATTTIPVQPTVDIDIEGDAFAKPVITVSVGTTVRWTNLDYTYHTVTSDTGLFDSSSLSPAEGELINASFSYTFTEPGTFNYHCSIHPDMTGVVIVESQ
jgi:plastocyanin